MIAYLNGIVFGKFQKNIILRVDNTGYEVFLTKPMLEKIKEQDKLELFIYTHVREDALTLFGFSKIEELKFFRQLINVPGIGPKLAVDLLTLPMEKIKAGIIKELILRLN